MTEEKKSDGGTTFWVGIATISAGLAIMFGLGVGLVFLGIIATTVGLYILWEPRSDDRPELGRKEGEK